MKRSLPLTAVFVLAGMALSSTAPAQTWPDKQVTMITNFPPGGSTDTVARAVSAKLSEQFHQTFVVENRAGATGTIGAFAVKRAPPDGYTFLVTSLGPMVITPHLIKQQYDPLTDFDLITVAVQSPNALVVPAASPFKSLADMISYEKAHPNKLTFASSGTGSSDHLTAELFWQQSGVTGVHVPYKGGAPAVSDLLGGQVSASFQNVNAVLANIKAGKLRALAVTGSKRSAVLPDVPTMEEAGVKNVVVYSWQAIAAPKGLPPEVKAKANAAMVAALDDPTVKQQFVAMGFEVVADTPEQFAAFEQQEYARWKKVIATGHITAE